MKTVGFILREDLYIRAGAYARSQDVKKNEAISALLGNGLVIGKAEFGRRGGRVSENRGVNVYRAVSYAVPDEVEDRIVAITRGGYTRTYLVNRILELALDETEKAA